MCLVSMFQQTFTKIYHPGIVRNNVKMIADRRKMYVNKVVKLWLKFLISHCINELILERNFTNAKNVTAFLSLTLDCNSCNDNVFL